MSNTIKEVVSNTRVYKGLIFVSRSQAIRDTGITYIGSVNKSVKHEKAYKYNELTYGIYLAPGRMSGYEVCPGRTKECTESCLNESGFNLRYDINEYRINRTRLFFENREYFMRWMIEEIKVARIRSEKLGYAFSVRINNTSDISPESFYLRDILGVNRNILEIFSDVQFYDYSKVSNRVELLKKYKNYDLTYSFNGYNFLDCEKMLNNKVRVAFVFKGKLPKKFMGRKVIDADLYDMRYRDPKNVICGLKYKTVRNKLEINNKFVIQL